ncbi:uncharacterized protein [Rhodnius prolixus]
MRIVGLQIILLIFYLSFILLQIFFTFMGAIFSDGDFFLMAHSLHISFIYSLMPVLTFTAITLRSHLSNIYKIIGNGFYEYDEVTSKEGIQIKLKYFKMKRNLKIGFPLLAFVAMLLAVTAIPLSNEYFGLDDSVMINKKGVNLWLPLNGWYPFDSSEGLPFWIAFSLQGISMILVANIYVAGSTTYFTIVLHVIVQYHILIWKLRNITKRAMVNYLKIKPYLQGKNRSRPNFEDMEFQKQMVFCLKQNIQHYQQIIRVVNLYAEVLKVSGFIVFLCITFIIALSAFIIVTGTARPGIVCLTFGIATAELGYMTALCVLGQMIIDLNEQLHFELYNIPWYRCSKDFKQCMNITQARIGYGVAITTLFDYVMDMDTYCKLVNTSYSYFSLLLAFKST